LFGQSEKGYFLGGGVQQIALHSTPPFITSGLEGGYDPREPCRLVVVEQVEDLLFVRAKALAEHALEPCESDLDLWAVVGGQCRCQ
jgi:hypothetical protein